MRNMKDWTPDEIEYIKQNHEALSFAQMGEHLGRTAKSVQHKCLRIGMHLSAEARSRRIRDNAPILRGESNPNWKGGISKNHYHYKKLQVQRYPERVRARKLLARAVEACIVQRQPCEVCGDVKVQAHHDDYSRPLDVRWFCKLHHDNLHAQIGKGHDMVSPEHQAA